MTPGIELMSYKQIRVTDEPHLPDLVSRRGSGRRDLPLQRFA
jgi:hypothetical protein